jgi:hypothetical protein
MMQDIHEKLRPGLPWQKQHSTRGRLSTSKLDSQLRKKIVKCYISSIASYGAETWTLRKLDHKYLESFEIIITKLNSVILARKLTIPTERLPRVGEVDVRFEDRGCRVVSATDPHGR